VTGALIAAFAVIVAGVAALSTNGLPFTSRYHLRAMVPPGAPTLRTGIEVRLNGASAGIVDEVKPARDGGQDVDLRLRISPVGSDGRLIVRMRSAAGQHYLELRRGDYRDQPLDSGASLPADRVSYMEDFPTVVQDFSRRALSETQRALRLGGEGFLGRGRDLNESFRDIDSTMRDTKTVLRAAAPGEALPALIRGLSATTAALQGKERDDAGRATTATARLFSALSAPDARLDGLIETLPGAEDQALDVLPRLDPLLVDAERLAIRLRPGVRALRSALPPLNRVLSRGRLVRTEVRRLAAAAQPALRALMPALERLGPSAVLLRRGLSPLGTLAAYVSRFPQDLEAGLTGYYGASRYRPNVGRAHGAAVSPTMAILTCAPGHNADPTPGSYLSDRLDAPCR
jgi:ABC-type transporter Mla subunit MlaD